MGRLRRYKAHTLEACMDAARRDFGPDALIHAVRTRREGVVLLGRRRVVHELLAGPAADVASIAAAGSQEREASLRGAAAVRAYSGVAPDGPGELDRRRTRLLAQAMAIRLERDAEAQRLAIANERAVRAASGMPEASGVERLDPSLDGESRVPAPVEPSARRFVLVPATGHPSRSAASSGEPISMHELAGDLRSLRALVERIVAARESGEDRRLAEQFLETPSPWSEPIDAARFGAPLTGFYASLIGQRMARELARRLVEETHEALSPQERCDPIAARRALRERVAALLPPCLDVTTESAAGERLGGALSRGDRARRPRVVSLVGPTGTGKTTTIAKLAAEYALRRQRRVGLVTTDTFRIGAIEQLRTYADIVGLPLLVADDCESLRRACEAMADRDVILVDTAGRGHADGERVRELAGLLRAASPDETHLVLSSTAHADTLRAEAEAFAGVGVDRVVVAKLDEAVGFGVLIEALGQIGRPLSWITTGQHVPNDLEPARSERLVDAILGGGTT